MQFRCTDPIPLHDSEKHLSEGQFEKSFDWKLLSVEQTPAPLALSMGIGRSLDWTLWAELVDLKTMGSELRHDLENRSIHPTMLALMQSRARKKKETGNDLTSKFYLFQTSKKNRNALIKKAKNETWKGLLSDFLVLASRSHYYDTDYAVILANSLDSISICVRLPAEELEWYESREREIEELLKATNQVALKLSAQEIQDVAFRFSVELNQFRSGQCEADLSSIPKQ